MRRRALYQKGSDIEYLDVEPKYIWVSTLDDVDVSVYSNTDWWID